MKITSKNWAPKFLHIDTFQKETVADHYPTGKQDNSLHDSISQLANPQLSSIKTIPKKIPKERGGQLTVHFTTLGHQDRHRLDPEN